MHKQALLAILLAGGLALPAVSYAQAPPVGASGCVQSIKGNCTSPGGGGRSGAPGGGGGGGTANAIGAGIFGLGIISDAARQSSQVSQTAVQSQITGVRDRLQRRDTTSHKKKKTTTKGQPLGW